MTTQHKYKPTGYGSGRPRNGEMRPPSPNAISQAKYRDKKKQTDPEYKNFLAIYQKLWVLANPERNKEIKRKTNQRRRGWNKFLEE